MKQRECLSQGSLAIASLLTAAFALVAGDGLANGVSVKKLTDKRIGGYSEGITFVDKGDLANHIAFVDGFEVWGLPVGHGNPKARRLFDLRSLDIDHPTGIAHIESRKLFVVNDITQLTTLFLADHQGRPKAS